MFIAAEEVVIEGTVEGDVFTAGGRVEVSGEIQGDLFVAGGMVDISGRIGEDLRVAAGNVNIRKAEIGDGVLAVGGNIDLDNETTVGGGIIFAGGALDSSAEIGRGVVGGGGQVNLDGPIGKDSYLGAGMITLGTDAELNGNLTYQADQEINLRDSATVSGKINRIPIKTKEFKEIEGKTAQKTLKAVGFAFQVGSFLGALLVGMIFLNLFPSLFEKVDAQIKDRFLQSLGWGLIVLIIGPITFLLLSLTIIGLPLAMISLMVFIVELYLIKVFAGYTIGQWLQQTLDFKTNKYLAYTIGLLAYYLIRLVPVIDFFVVLLTVLAVLGALFSFKKEKLFS